MKTRSGSGSGFSFPFLLSSLSLSARPLPAALLLLLLLLLPPERNLPPASLPSLLRLCDLRTGNLLKCANSRSVLTSHEFEEMGLMLSSRLFTSTEDAGRKVVSYRMQIMKIHYGLRP